LGDQGDALVDFLGRDRRISQSKEIPRPIVLIKEKMPWLDHDAMGQ
jgi:hypothetical protein